MDEICTKHLWKNRVFRVSGSQSFACRISPRSRLRGGPDLIDCGRAQPFLRLARYSPRLAYAWSTSSTWYCLRSHCFHNTRNPVPPSFSNRVFHDSGSQHTHRRTHGTVNGCVASIKREIHRFSPSLFNGAIPRLPPGGGSRRSRVGESALYLNSSACRHLRY